MEKYWNGKGSPAHGQLYLDEDSQLCALIECFDGLFIGKMIEHPSWGEHALPALSISRRDSIQPDPRYLSESTTHRTLEQLQQETKALISEMFQCGVPFNDIDVIRRSVTKEDAFRETEHIEALLMNRVFDRCGDLLFVERAKQAAR
ncbi:hypothetical protein EHW61_16495 [Salinivibrio sp. VYel6]|uniref:hypothetical protein n=1 Tax=Salinivibrio sp. VYel6 TaxID=2490493 RepID=UPI00128D44B9|nr:hypothetical protein [Salinivibrio sp. VYel6]MPX98226.1 hypothetical protein [Salinivibrio sp. VYel6]